MQTINFDPLWQQKYKAMLSTAKEAATRLAAGQRVFIATGCAEPVALVQAMVNRAAELTDLEIIHLLTKGEAPYAAPELAECFRVNSFFIGHNVRSQIQVGQGDYTPIMLSELPGLFNSGRMPIDIALIQVTPPDQHGRVSLGISVDIVKSAAENASLVIALVNDKMPFTFGDSLLDINDLDILVPTSTPLLERASKPIHPATATIARHIAALIEDGSTIQFGMGRVPGIGRIPPAVMTCLKDKHDLGIHTEMLTDSVIDLLESGAVTGKNKTIDRGRVVASFCMGSKRLYDLVNQNPLFCFKPSDYVNDPYIISRNEKMVAINMAMAIDLTGQVCVDSAGEKFYSGMGGQIDFNRGAARSKDGKPIIVCPALDNKGLSRIVTRLRPGSGVGITRGDVHYVVTEHGVAYLHGKTVQERALALISIANPDCREDLFKEAIAANLIRHEYAGVEGSFVVRAAGKQKLITLDDGTQVTLRPIKPTDEQGIKNLVYTLSQESLYYRFMTHTKQFGAKQILDFIYVDHRKNVAVVITVPEGHDEDIIGIGRYFLDERSNRAEVAFMVRDEWQHRGIGSILFNRLVTIAKQSGIAGFTAEVLRDNRKMQNIFNRSGFKVVQLLEDDVYSFSLDF
ncbi:MAG: GNAT family N-acetyltransferase [Deltaproteobacteria bacterium]|nr:GNAT family N-acetyltransferase [Deltaproteobacteria bacterium]